MNPRESKARPGTRAPHVWLERRGEQISTLDLFGRNFTLLAEVHRIGANGLTDPSGGFSSAYGITSAGAVLVRPDGFVAWRAKTGDGASADQIRSVLAALLR